MLGKNFNNFEIVEGISPTIISFFFFIKQSLIMYFAAFSDDICFVIFLKSFLFMLSAIIGVSTVPGQNVLKETPLLRYSRLRDSVKPNKANLEAE